MSVFVRYASLAAALLMLGACDPRFVHGSNLSTTEIEHLSGTWAGESTLSFASKNYCPRAYLWSLHVAGGNVDGSVVDKNTPLAPPATFTSYVDYDGSVHAAVRTAGRDFALLGTFSHHGFDGTVRSGDCNYAISLSREAKAS